MLEEASVGTLSELGLHLSRSSLNLLAEKEPWEFLSKESASFGEDIIQFWPNSTTATEIRVSVLT